MSFYFCLFFDCVKCGLWFVLFFFFCFIFIVDNISDLIDRLFCQAPTHCRYKHGYNITPLFMLFIEDTQTYKIWGHWLPQASPFLLPVSSFTCPSPYTLSISSALYGFFSLVSAALYESLLNSQSQCHKEEDSAGKDPRGPRASSKPMA